MDHQLSENKFFSDRPDNDRAKHDHPHGRGIYHAREPVVYRSADQDRKKRDEKKSDNISDVHKRNTGNAGAYRVAEFQLCGLILHGLFRKYQIKSGQSYKIKRRKRKDPKKPRAFNERQIKLGRHSFYNELNSVLNARVQHAQNQDRKADAEKVFPRRARINSDLFVHFNPHFSAESGGIIYF